MERLMNIIHREIAANHGDNDDTHEKHNEDQREIDEHLGKTGTVQMRDFSSKTQQIA